MQTSHIQYLIYFFSKPPEVLRWGYRFQLQIASQDLSEITWLFRRTHNQKKVPPAPESRAEDFKSKAQQGVRPPERRLSFWTVVPGMQISPLPQVTGLLPSRASTWGRDAHLQVVVGTEVNLWKCPAECLVLCGSWMPWGCSLFYKITHLISVCKSARVRTHRLSNHWLRDFYATHSPRPSLLFHWVFLFLSIIRWPAFTECRLI